MFLFGGGIFVPCARKAGFIIMSVALCAMVKIASFGRMFGWVECCYMIDYMICRCWRGVSVWYMHFRVGDWGTAWIWCRRLFIWEEELVGEHRLLGLVETPVSLYGCPLVIRFVLVVLPCFGHLDLVNTLGWFVSYTPYAGWITVVNIISHFSLLKKKIYIYIYIQ